MTIISLKINDRTKSGKAFMMFLEQFIIQKDSSVEVINMPNLETLKAMSNIEAGIGITKTKSHDDLMKKLNS